MGVRITRRESQVEETLNADLVVDASGRGSQAPTWLRALGYDAPHEDTVKVGVGYTSRVYRRKPEHLRGNVAILVSPALGASLIRGGGMLAQEGDRWQVTLGGYFGDHAPATEEGFLEFARSLPTPDVYNTIIDSEPLSDFAVYKYGNCQRRRYERLSRFPEGFLIFGDAICSFNPLYGQGMTVAAQEAHTLNACLAQGRGDLAKRFFAQAAKVVDVPWSIAVGGDLAIPQVEGERTRMTRFLNWYMAKVQVAARRDKAVTVAFHKVNNLLAPPPSILSPAIALRVLRANLKARQREKARAAASQVVAS
jgi:hypothetical protein